MNDMSASENQLVAAAANSDGLASAQLARIITANSQGSGRQSAFDCLELWGDHPDHVEPLYAAASLFYESGNVHLGLMVLEYATTMRVRPQGNSSWPLHEEATGWQMDLLYARLLVQADRTAEAMAYYGSVLVNCGDALRPQITDEVTSAAQKLPLVDVRTA